MMAYQNKLQTLQAQRQSYEAKLAELILDMQETTIVNSELNHLETDVVIYEKMGPLLIRSDLQDVKLSVARRLDIQTNNKKEFEKRINEDAMKANELLSQQAMIFAKRDKLMKNMKKK